MMFYRLNFEKSFEFLLQQLKIEKYETIRVDEDAVIKIPQQQEMILYGLATVISDLTL